MQSGAPEFFYKMSQLAYPLLTSRSATQNELTLAGKLL
ncbi:hypothetical protein MRBBS_0979 [Marinobacter sp. BSs20148]|nr:hypothetical protein MRBBS_0979 [Marinobacter sp. BSs20148]